MFISSICCSSSCICSFFVLIFLVDFFQSDRVLLLKSVMRFPKDLLMFFVGIVFFFEFLKNELAFF